MIRWGLPALLVAVALAGLWAWWPRGEQPTILELQLQPVPDLLHEHAVLISAQQQPIKCAISGTITSMVASGTRVEPGDSLFVQDAEDLQQRLEQKEAEVEEEEAGREQHLQELKLAELEIANQEAINDAELAWHRFRLEQARGGPDAVDRRLLAIDIELAQLDLEESREELERSRRLVERGLQSQTRLEEAERSYITRQTALRELQIEQALREAGPTAIELSEIEADLARAEGKVARARLARERRIARIKRDIAIREAQITKVRQELAHAETDLASVEQTAPVAGIAMPRSYRDWRSGGRKVEVGPGIKRWTGDVLVDIVDPSSLQAVIMVNEVDYPRLRQDMPVTIRLEAYPDRSLPGRISFLAGIGRDRGEIAINEVEGPNTGVSVFSATIDFEADIDLRPGMTGIVEIPLDDSHRALVVPRSYLLEDDDGLAVWRQGADGTERVPVEGLPYGSHGLEITSGLEVGDRLRLPAEVADE